MLEQLLGQIRRNVLGQWEAEYFDPKRVKSRNYTTEAVKERVYEKDKGYTERGKSCPDGKAVKRPT